MSSKPTQMRPFSGVEFMIAWRYLRARRAEGGVSVMTWISLLGVTLAVFALIVTLAVRAGFRAEFIDTILGANAHSSVYSAPYIDESGHETRGFRDYTEIAHRLAAIPGVTRAAPLIRGQAMAASSQSTNGAEVFGLTSKDFQNLPRIGIANTRSLGDITHYGAQAQDGVIGIAMGRVLALELGVGPGARLRLISPNGVRTAFGTSPRVNIYEVAYIFSSGRYDVDKTRIYMPFVEAQRYFNREGRADEFEIMVTRPEEIDTYTAPLLRAAGPTASLWTWRNSAGAFLNALDIEDNIMFIILSALVLIATMNITSGLIMLVRNKGRDIGVLRTMGFSEGAILRIFFLCGAFIGVVGTALGVVLGCLFSLYIEPIFAALNAWIEGGVWDPSVRGIYTLPARLLLKDVASAVGLSLGLSFVVTFFPARRAARMNPVEALRYE